MPSNSSQTKVQIRTDATANQVIHIRMLFGCPATYYTSELRPHASSPGLVATALAYSLLAVSVSVQFKTPAANNVNHASLDVGVFPTRSKQMRSPWVFLHAFKTQFSTRAFNYLGRGFAFAHASAHDVTCMYVCRRAGECGHVCTHVFMYAH